MQKPGMNYQRQLWEQMMVELCHQRSLTRVDIDDHCSRGVKSQIFFKLLA